MVDKSIGRAKFKKFKDREEIELHQHETSTHSKTDTHFSDKNNTKNGLLCNDSKCENDQNSYTSLLTKERPACLAAKRTSDARCDDVRDCNLPEGKHKKNSYQDKTRYPVLSVNNIDTPKTSEQTAECVSSTNGNNVDPTMPHESASSCVGASTSSIASEKSVNTYVDKSSSETSINEQIPSRNIHKSRDKEVEEREACIQDQDRVEPCSRLLKEADSDRDNSENHNSVQTAGFQLQEHTKNKHASALLNCSTVVDHSELLNKVDLTSSVSSANDNDVAVCRNNKHRMSVENKVNDTTVCELKNNITTSVVSENFIEKQNQMSQSVVSGSTNSQSGCATIQKNNSSGHNFENIQVSDTSHGIKLLGKARCSTAENNKSSIQTETRKEHLRLTPVYRQIPCGSGSSALKQRSHTENGKKEEDTMPLESSNSTHTEGQHTNNRENHEPGFVSTKDESGNYTPCKIKPSLKRSYVQGECETDWKGKRPKELSRASGSGRRSKLSLKLEELFGVDECDDITGGRKNAPKMSKTQNLPEVNKEIPEIGNKSTTSPTIEQCSGEPQSKLLPSSREDKVEKKSLLLFSNKAISPGLKPKVLVSKPKSKQKIEQDLVYRDTKRGGREKAITEESQDSERSKSAKEKVMQNWFSDATNPPACSKSRFTEKDTPWQLKKVVISKKDYARRSSEESHKPVVAKVGMHKRNSFPPMPNNKSGVMDEQNLVREDDVLSSAVHGRRHSDIEFNGTNVNGKSERPTESCKSVLELQTNTVSEKIGTVPRDVEGERNTCTTNEKGILPIPHKINSSESENLETENVETCLTSVFVKDEEKVCDQNEGLATEQYISEIDPLISSIGSRNNEAIETTFSVKGSSSQAVSGVGDNLESLQEDDAEKGIMENRKESVSVEQPCSKIGMSFITEEPKQTLHAEVQSISHTVNEEQRPKESIIEEESKDIDTSIKKENSISLEANNEATKENLSVINNELENEPGINKDKPENTRGNLQLEEKRQQHEGVEATNSLSVENKIGSIRVKDPLALGIDIKRFEPDSATRVIENYVNSFPTQIKDDLTDLTSLFVTGFMDFDRYKARKNDAEKLPGTSREIELTCANKDFVLSFESKCGVVIKKVNFLKIYFGDKFEQVLHTFVNKRRPCTIQELDQLYQTFAKQQTQNINLATGNSCNTETEKTKVIVNNEGGNNAHFESQSFLCEVQNSVKRCHQKVLGTGNLATDTLTVGSQSLNKSSEELDDAINILAYHCGQGSSNNFCQGKNSSINPGTMTNAKSVQGENASARDRVSSQAARNNVELQTTSSRCSSSSEQTSSSASNLNEKEFTAAHRVNTTQHQPASLQPIISLVEQMCASNRRQVGLALTEQALVGVLSQDETRRSCPPSGQSQRVYPPSGQPQSQHGCPPLGQPQSQHGCLPPVRSQQQQQQQQSGCQLQMQLQHGGPLLAQQRYQQQQQQRQQQQPRCSPQGQPQHGGPQLGQHWHQQQQQQQQRQQQQQQLGCLPPGQQPQPQQSLCPLLGQPQRHCPPSNQQQGHVTSGQLQFGHTPSKLRQVLIRYPSLQNGGALPSNLSQLRGACLLPYTSQPQVSCPPPYPSYVRAGVPASYHNRGQMEQLSSKQRPQQETYMPSNWSQLPCYQIQQQCGSVHSSQSCNVANCKAQGQAINGYLSSNHSLPSSQNFSQPGNSPANQSQAQWGHTSLNSNAVRGGFVPLEQTLVRCIPSNSNQPHVDSSSANDLQVGQVRQIPLYVNRSHTGQQPANQENTNSQLLSRAFSQQMSHSTTPVSQVSSSRAQATQLVSQDKFRYIAPKCDQAQPVASTVPQGSQLPPYSVHAAQVPSNVTNSVIVGHTSTSCGTTSHVTPQQVTADACSKAVPDSRFVGAQSVTVQGGGTLATLLSTHQNTFQSAANVTMSGVLHSNLQGRQEYQGTYTTTSSVANQVNSVSRPTVVQNCGVKGTPSADENRNYVSPVTGFGRQPGNQQECGLKQIEQQSNKTPSVTQIVRAVNSGPLQNIASPSNVRVMGVRQQTNSRTQITDVPSTTCGSTVPSAANVTAEYPNANCTTVNSQVQRSCKRPAIFGVLTSSQSVICKTASQNSEAGSSGERSHRQVHSSRHHPNILNKQSVNKKDLLTSVSNAASAVQSGMLCETNSENNKIPNNSSVPSPQKAATSMSESTLLSLRSLLSSNPDISVTALGSLVKKSQYTGADQDQHASHVMVPVAAVASNSKDSSLSVRTQADKLSPQVCTETAVSPTSSGTKIIESGSTSCQPVSNQSFVSHDYSAGSHSVNDSSNAKSVYEDGLLCSPEQPDGLNVSCAVVEKPSVPLSTHCDRRTGPSPVTAKDANLPSTSNKENCVLTTATVPNAKMCTNFCENAVQPQIPAETGDISYSSQLVGKTPSNHRKSSSSNSVVYSNNSLGSGCASPTITPPVMNCKNKAEPEILLSEAHAMRRGTVSENIASNSPTNTMSSVNGTVTNNSTIEKQCKTTPGIISSKESESCKHLSQSEIICELQGNPSCDSETVHSADGGSSSTVRVENVSDSCASSCIVSETDDTAQDSNKQITEGFDSDCFPAANAVQCTKQILISENISNVTDEMEEMDVKEFVLSDLSVNSEISKKLMSRVCFDTKKELDSVSAHLEIEGRNHHAEAVPADVNIVNKSITKPLEKKSEVNVATPAVVGSTSSVDNAFNSATKVMSPGYGTEREYSSVTVKRDNTTSKSKTPLNVSCRQSQNCDIDISDVERAEVQCLFEDDEIEIIEDYSPVQFLGYKFAKDKVVTERSSGSQHSSDIVPLESFSKNISSKPADINSVKETKEAIGSNTAEETGSKEMNNETAESQSRKKVSVVTPTARAMGESEIQWPSSPEPRTVSRDSGYTTPSDGAAHDAQEITVDGDINCAFCTNTAQILCTGCYITCYCSTDCQTRHWQEVHYEECKLQNAGGMNQAH